MSTKENNKITINNINKKYILSSIIAEENPIFLQLEEFGYDNVYSRRVLYYLQPEDLEEALNYMSIENGIIQHRFVHDRDISNNKCYLCGEEKKIHLNELYNNIILSNNENNNANIKNSLKYQEDKREENNLNQNDNQNNYLITINNTKTDLINSLRETTEKEKDELSIFGYKTQKKNIKEQIFNSITKPEIKNNEKMINCEICNELFLAYKRTKVEKCGHAFCSDCWFDSLSIKIQENKLPSIKCLDYKCKEKLSDDFIINILSRDINLLKKYKRYKLELEIINSPNKKLCPYPDCDSYLELKDILNKDVTCKNNHTYCFECLKKPHGKLPCNEDIDKSLADYAINNFVKKCPKCGIIIEKSNGCNHITCTQCGYQWCWLCNEKYNILHFQEGKCKGFQFFKPKNAYEIKLLMEGKINLDDLSLSQRQYNYNFYENNLDIEYPIEEPIHFDNIITDNFRVTDEIINEGPDNHKSILLYILLGNFYYINKFLQINNKYLKNVQKIIYSLLYISFFFHFIISNIATAILILVIFKRLKVIDKKLYIIITMIYLISLFFILLILWFIFII